MVGHLIAAWYTDPENWLAILEVAIGLGFVIFVHELGHFSVAQLCGVKCEKFYLGFDIAGLKLLKFRRGETEYGIGILPLGGYVKMLGQEDNPAKLREEIERAKQPASGESAADQAAAGDAELEAARQALFNPRSYLAQSVPRRMAIISAGVIMNLIFAWIMAVVAIRCFSVREPAPGVGNILPGDGAWQADIRTGDTVLEVRGQPVKSYGDILEAVALGDAKHNIPMVISRPGRPEPLHVSVKVRQAGGKPRIGIGLPQTATLNKEDGVATFAATPAAEAQPPLAGGDKLVQLDEQPIHNAAELHAYLGEHADKPLRVTVQRALPAEKGAPPKDAKTQQLSVRVDSRPMRWLGVIMEMGPISAIQDGSPAAAAGIRSGDVLRTVDGAAVADPMTLPERFRGRAGQVVKLGIERPGEGVKEVSLTLRPGAGFDDPMGEDCPLAISSLGIAYHVLNNVHAVVPGTPAAAAGLQSGDVIAKATVLALDKETLERLRKEFPHSVIVADAEELLFDETHRDWPLFMYALQTPALEGAKVELQWTRGKESMKKTLDPGAAAPRKTTSPATRWTLQSQEGQPVPRRNPRRDRRGGRPHPDPRRRPAPAADPKTWHGQSLRRYRKHPAEGLPQAAVQPRHALPGSRPGLLRTPAGRPPPGRPSRRQARIPRLRSHPLPHPRTRPRRNSPTSSPDPYRSPQALTSLMARVRCRTPS